MPVRPPSPLVSLAGPGAVKLPLSVIVTPIVTRLVLLPLLGGVVVVGAFKLGWLKAPDPMFLLVRTAGLPDKPSKQR